MAELIEQENVLYEGTITEAMEFLAKGQNAGLCAVLDRCILCRWTTMEAYVGDEIESKQGTHDVHKMHFSEDGHEYAITYTQMAHPNPMIGKDAFLILQVMKDGEELSHSWYSIQSYSGILFDLAEVEG